jgi:predicted phosphoadenosine phosphosulfate sulfurtransferase
VSVYVPKAKQASRKVIGSQPLFVGDARPQYIVPNYNVFEAALDRIRWIFDEFEGKVMVSNSGGKDSTVVLELAARVAKEKGYLPLNVMWLDQECEFQSTVDYQRHLMYERDDINFRWYQIPFKLENATNLTDHYLNVWGEGEEWVREREPGSIHENRFGVTDFYEVMAAINEQDWQGAMLDGMRCEESPARRLLMLSKPSFKYATWSTWGNDKLEHHLDGATWRFQPIFDWSYRDVWKAIYENGWRYNEHYDHLFHRGVPIRSMRVSNYHHEQALSSLQWLQEVEPETWEQATRRLKGINTYGHLKTDQYPKELPYMFSSWEEYMDYLIDNLVPEETGVNSRETFRKQFHRVVTSTDVGREYAAQVIIKAVIGGDYYGTHIKNFLVSHRAKRGKEKAGEKSNDEQ